jgi:hypothetical protein
MSKYIKLATFLAQTLDAVLMLYLTYLLVIAIYSRNYIMVCLIVIAKGIWAISMSVYRISKNTSPAQIKGNML